MTYTQNNQLATYNGQAVEYDADGNMISGPLKGSITNFAFDSRNRLISAGNMSYGYDAENNRIAVITNGQQTNYVINPQAKLSQMLIKTDAQGNNTYYVYGLGLIGQEDAEGIYKNYHFDNRGSTTAITDIQGEVTDTFAYAPFGELIQRTGTTDTPFLYNGRDGVMTDSNGLYYMRARYYNPEIKRFINQDVLQGSIDNGQSMNRYAYVNGNPVSQVDPFGLCAESTNSNSWIHLILGGISYIPGLNVPASLLDFGLYLKEGDHVNAGIAMACIVPFAKEGVLGVRVAEAVLESGSRIIKAVDEAGVIAKVTKGAGKAVKPYQVGTFDELSKMSKPNDGIEIHHVVQKHPAGQIIDEYDQSMAPSIALPRMEHRGIPNLRGDYLGSARDLLSRDIRNLRNYTDAPNSSLRELINLNKEMYPDAFKK